MRSWILSVLIVTSLAVIACSPVAARPGPLQDFANACDKVNEGELIAVEGYLRLPDSFTNGATVELRLYSDLSFRGQPIGVTMSFGDAPNQATRIDSSFRDSDLKVHLADGSQVPFGTRVRVSGIMYYPIAAQEFECGLQNPHVELAK